MVIRFTPRMWNNSAGVSSGICAPCEFTDGNEPCPTPPTSASSAAIHAGARSSRLLAGAACARSAGRSGRPRCLSRSWLSRRPSGLNRRGKRDLYRPFRQHAAAQGVRWNPEPFRQRGERNLLPIVFDHARAAVRAVWGGDTPRRLAYTILQGFPEYSRTCNLRIPRREPYTRQE